MRAAFAGHKPAPTSWSLRAGVSQTHGSGKRAASHRPRVMQNTCQLQWENASDSQRRLPLPLSPDSTPPPPDASHVSSSFALSQPVVSDAAFLSALVLLTVFHFSFSFIFSPSDKTPCFLLWLNAPERKTRQVSFVTVPLPAAQVK